MVCPFVVRMQHGQVFSLRGPHITHGSRKFSSGGGGGVGGGRGVQVNLTKSTDKVFLFVFFLVLSLFFRSQMLNFKENYHFSRFQRGPTFSRGVQLFPGGGGGGSPIAYSL